MAEHQVEDAPDFVEPAQSASSFNFLRLGWRHKALIALGIVVGCVLGALYYARATPLYQSSAQVLVVKKTPEVLPLSAGESRSAASEDYLSTHQTLIRSPAIVGEAVREARLEQLPSFAGRGNPTGEIISSLKVTQETNAGRQTNILNISCRSQGPEDSALVVNAVISSYQKFLNGKYKSVTDETAKLITDAGEILEKKLNQKQKEYDEFSLENPVLWRNKDGVSITQEHLVNLETRRAALQLKVAEIKGHIQALQTLVKEGGHSQAELLAMISQTASSRAGEGRDVTGATSALEVQLLNLEIQQKSLQADYGPDYPQLQAVQQQVGLLRKQLKRLGSVSDGEGALIPDLVKAHIETLKLEQASTQKAAETVGNLIQEEQQKAKGVRSTEKQDENYRMEIARTQQLFDAVSKRLDEVSILKNFVGGYEAATIAPPEPGRKVEPRPVPIFGAAVLLGLLAGFALAYVAELSDLSFKTPEEIRRHLGLPIVGHIPFYKAKEDDLVIAASPDGPGLDPALCTVYHPKSRESEAYRGVRTSLYFSTHGAGHKVIQVTSPDMGDGKTTLAANLAASIAQSEKKVVLIDADLRRPRIHKLFNVSAKQGLTSVISGAAELDDVIQATAVPGLFVLPCGPIPQNPAELLTVPRFGEMIGAIREKFDFVIVDTPPLLAVTDPCMVVPHVDGVLLTVRMSKNVKPHALRAKEILVTLGANVIGVVVTGVGRDSGAYGYDNHRYGYTYSANYYSGNEKESYYTSAADVEAETQPSQVPVGQHTK